jgi:hypothetical protein
VAALVMAVLELGVLVHALEVGGVKGFDGLVFPFACASPQIQSPSILYEFDY